MPVAQQREVLGDHDAHGTSARSDGRAAGGLATRSVPSSASTRLRRPSSPCAVGVGAAARRRRDLDAQAAVLARTTRTVGAARRACLAALVSASATTK